MSSNFANVPRKAKNNRNRARRGTRVRPVESDLLLYSQARIPRSLGGNSAMPPYMMRDLHFHEVVVLQNAGASYFVKDYRANSAYDPDPSLGGGSLSYFNELAAIYSMYKVHAISLSWNVVSNEPSVPVCFAVVFRDAQPSTLVSSYADTINLIEVPPSKKAQMVGQTTGASRIVGRVRRLPISSIVGNALVYEADFSYASAVTTNPAQLTWFGLVAHSYSASVNLSNGCIVDLNVIYHTQFFSLQGLGK